MHEEIVREAQGILKQVQDNTKSELVVNFENLETSSG
jgi:hypothetical protein